MPEETAIESFQRAMRSHEDPRASPRLNGHNGHPVPTTNGSTNGVINGSHESRSSALYNTTMRHGFAAEYESEYYMNLLAEDKRHETSANPRPVTTGHDPNSEWRMKDRQRTVTAAIVLCLNIGVDPPDVIKTQPCAKLEAWVDPTAYSDPKKAIEQIGKQLQSQYEILSTRTRFKSSLDPNVEEAKRFCISLRRSAKDERILFHYNGHGVPRPTASGEIWVFNRGYTQYIPVSLYDLQTWLGAPCIFVFDCHAAGNIVSNFARFVRKRKADQRENGREPGMIAAEAYDECIILAACGTEEVLPMHPELPADLFSCCLTSPIEIAIRWFVMQSPLSSEYYPELSIPGRITDRRTPLGELNWIFTAITDTIAWALLPRPLFKKLFRQDLVVAALFRNFLLAERIMRVHSCHPISSPSLPPTHNHPMWDAWDLAVDQCLSQLPLMSAAEKEGTSYEYKHSRFFEEQLTAFEVWLKYESSNLDHAPEQLPVVLQVLLSQIHRLRALILLSKYLDLGPKAVHLALSIGIFPYVLKLLQSPAQELKPVLVFIWARIMSVDYRNIQQELLKDNGYAYFIHILVPQEGFVINNINVSEHRAMCAFVIALFCRDFEPGKRVCTGPDIMQACLSYTMEPESPLLRQWACLCISQLWDNHPEARWLAIKDKVFDRLCRLLSDPIPEVRTACLVALTTFLGSSSGSNSVNSAGSSIEIRQREISLALSALGLSNDASSVVRKEVVVFFSRFVNHYINNFIVTAFSCLQEETALARDEPGLADDVRANSPSYGTIFAASWRALLVLTEDPFIEVADMAQDVVDYVIALLESTPLAEEVESLESSLLYSLRPSTIVIPSIERSQSTLNSSTPTPPNMASRSVSGPHESRFTSTLKRSVSFAANLTGFGWVDSGDSAKSLASSQGGASNNSNGPTVKIPYGSGIKPRTARYPGRAKDRDPHKTIHLPLASGFFDWCCEYFQEPQMSQSEVDEPGSERYTERVWRKSRNERIMSETQLQKDAALTGSWNTQIGFVNNLSQPTKLIFAQFEPHLTVVDDRDGVTIWDWTENTKLNRFSNSNPVDTKITEAKFLNEDDQPLLLTGSSEGVVRIYRHYDSSSKIELACSWRALTDILPAHKNSGLVADWQQSRGALLVGGDVKVIRVWDAPRELCTADIPARSGSPVTSLTSDQVAGNIIVAGFGDGTVRVYDRRLDPHDSLVKKWKNHRSWVVNIHMQRGGARELVSGSTDGQIYLWDIRSNNPVVQFKSDGAGTTRALDVHEHAPVIAVGSQVVSMWSTSGYRVAGMKSPGYMLHHRPVVSALSLHPHQMVLAVNNDHDGHVSIYSCTEDSFIPR